MSGILLRLGRDRPRVVRHKDYHSPLDSDVGEAHQRVGSDVKPDLFHGYKTSRARVCSSGSDFQGGFLVDGPLYIGSVISVFCCCFQYFGGRGSRIAGYQIHPCGDSAQGNRFIAH